MFFAIYFIRCPLSVDFASLLVAVLGVLVAILLVSNVYNLYDFKGKMVKIEKNEKDIEHLRFFTKKNEDDINVLHSKIDEVFLLSNLNLFDFQRTVIQRELNKDTPNKNLILVKYIEILKTISFLKNDTYLKYYEKKISSFIESIDYEIENKDLLIDLIESTKEIIKQPTIINLYDKIKNKLTNN